MNQHRLRKPVGPAVASLARRTAALKDAARRLWRWPREAASPSLTATIRLARLSSGRDGKTALQPNQKTGSMSLGRRTTHALQTADIFTWQRQPTGSIQWRTASQALTGPLARFFDRARTMIVA
jgi:hypothetical protein